MKIKEYLSVYKDNDISSIGIYSIECNIIDDFGRTIDCIEPTVSLIDLLKYSELKIAYVRLGIYDESNRDAQGQIYTIPRIRVMIYVDLGEGMYSKDICKNLYLVEEE